MSYMKDADGTKLDTIDIPSRSEMNTAIATQHTSDLTTFASKTYEKSGVELAYAENATGTATTVAISPQASALIPGCMIHVPADTVNPIHIDYGGAFNVTVAGGGLMALELWDVTAGGTGTLIHAVGLGNVAAQLALYSGFAQTVRGAYRLDLSATERILQLKTLLYRDGGSGLQAQVANGARNGPLQPTFISAVQR